MINHMYMGQFVDEKKVDENAHRRANDKWSPRDVLVHYHLFSEQCGYRETIPDKLDGRHKMYPKKEDKSV